MSLETKRLLISESIHQHFKLGTRFAVEKLLNTLSSNAKVFEWFEYGAAPYWFKVEITGLRDLDDNGERIMRAIDVAKNARSHCAAFDFRLNQDNQNLYVAQLQLTGGKITSDLNSHIEDKHPLYVAQFQLVSGRQKFDIFSNERRELLHNPHVGFVQLQTGRIKFLGDTEEIDSDSYGLYLLWLKKFWRQFNLNPVIKHYSDEEPPIDDDDFDETEFSGDFIKLFFNFHKSDESRLIVMNFARDDISPAEINLFPADGVLKSRRGYLSDRIFRAVFVRKNVTKLSI